MSDENCIEKTQERGPGAPQGNTNALKHGVYADRFLAPEERPVFDAIIAGLREDFTFNNSSDSLQLELLATCYLRFARALDAGDAEAVERFDRMIRAHLKDLKATKIAREGDEPRACETTPAEWATALLEKLAEAEANERMAGQPVDVTGDGTAR
ncbi:MAG: hypothetical protein ACYC64_10375 [Armatimonadota bacterium]